MCIPDVEAPKPTPPPPPPQRVAEEVSDDPTRARRERTAVRTGAAQFAIPIQRSLNLRG